MVCEVDLQRGKYHCNPNDAKPLFFFFFLHLHSSKTASVVGYRYHLANYAFFLKSRSNCLFKVTKFVSLHVPHMYLQKLQPTLQTNLREILVV